MEQKTKKENISRCIPNYKEKKIKWIFGSVGTLRYGLVKEADIYRVIKQHSRWIDRINPRKMYMMTSMIRDFFNIDIPECQNRLTNLPWKCYSGKRRLLYKTDLSKEFENYS